MKLKPENNRDRQWAAISYLWIFSVIILFAKQESAFVQHHARRGLVLFLISILIWVVPAIQFVEILVLMAMVYGFITAHLGEENSFYIFGKIGDLLFSKKHN